MKPLFRQAVFVCCVTVLTGAAAPTLAGDFKRFPEYAYEAKRDVDIEALRELLRQAQELQKAEEQAAKAASPDTPAVAAPAAPAPEGQAQARPAKPPAPAPTQAGCMYRLHQGIE